MPGIAVALFVSLLSPAPAAASERVELAAPEQRVAESESNSDSGSAIENPAPATEAPAPSPKPPRRSWQAELFIDVAYGFSSNWPDNHVYRGMYTAPRLHELAVHSVGAFVAHERREEEPWSCELGFHAGAAVDALTSNEPIPGGPDGKFAGSEVFKYIALANAGFEIPKLGTHVSAGVFEGPMGIGSFWTFHNWNYTTAWSANVVPYYLTGLRIVQPLPANLELAAWVVNGFQSYADLNSVPSGMVTLSWRPPPSPAPAPRHGDTGIELSTQVYFGPESRNLGGKDWLLYWDTWAIYDFDEHFSLAAVWDLGVDRVGRGQELRQLYTGGALFMRGTVLERKHARMDLALRPEASWDRDARFTGAEQWLFAGTATASLWLFNHLLLRAEYRYDHSTATNGYFYREEFGSDDAIALAPNQHTVFLSLTAWWDFWFGARDEGD